jgi:8-oxo-dGTP diphosphatase
VRTRIHLVRHAKAKSRANWTEPDELRPLTKRGRREAAVLAERLADEAVARLVTSPFARCVQTFEPLAEALDLAIETTDVLAEGAEGGQALRLLVSLARAESVAACTHGDVLYDVVRSVGATGARLDGPLDAPVASTWVLDVEDGRVVGASFVEQPPR